MTTTSAGEQDARNDEGSSETDGSGTEHGEGERKREEASAGITALASYTESERECSP